MNATERKRMMRIVMKELGVYELTVCQRCMVIYFVLSLGMLALCVESELGVVFALLANVIIAGLLVRRIPISVNGKAKEAGKKKEENQIISN